MNVHVLVVDDNEMNRDVLRRRLEREGITVSPAEDGVRALELLQTDSFDLILLDIMMPRMNGYQVLEHLKDDPLRHDIPVIVISAVDDLDSIVRCIELGADDYMFKPFNPILLKARVNASLEKRHLRQQSQSARKALVQEIEIPVKSIQDTINQLVSAGTISPEQARLLESIKADVGRIASCLSSDNP
jgi:adenylate cyclase